VESQGSVWLARVLTYTIETQSLAPLERHVYRKRESFITHPDSEGGVIMTTKVEKNEQEEDLERRNAARRIIELWKDAAETGRFAYEISILEQEEKASEERYRKRKEFEAWEKEMLTELEARQAKNQKEVQIMTTKIEKTEQEKELQMKREAAGKILDFHKHKWNYGDILAYLDQKDKESEERYRKRKEFEAWKKERLKALEERQAKN
jgi:hypothetical protein